jgi:hypothetical protein
MVLGDYWVLKLSSSGNIERRKCCGRSLDRDSYPKAAYEVIQTMDGGYLVTRLSTSNNGNITGGHHVQMWGTMGL